MVFCLSEATRYSNQDRKINQAPKVRSTKAFWLVLLISKAFCP